MTNPPFILEKGEKVLKEAESCQYSGVAYLTQGYASGFGTTVGNSNVGVGTGLFSGKQVKREGSIWDAKCAHLYMTNKRLVFCNAKIGTFTKKERSIGIPFAEIPYKNIKGLIKSSKLSNPSVELAVVGERGGIDNIKFWLLGSKEQRGKERDELFDVIKTSS